ncbi:MAG: hypothetical protein KJ737_05780 [Proteobacteria bacterium]|nr:hypothetical protein [Pseudomonadota bacterium]
MKCSKPVVLFAALAGIFIFLSGCGGGGGSDAAKEDDSPLKTYRVGGTVSGLAGILDINNRDGSSVSLDENGAFSFSQSYQNSTAYDIRIQNQPEGQICTITNGMGSINGDDVTSVTISCTTTATLKFSLKGYYDEYLSNPVALDITDTHAFVAEENGIKIFDISDVIGGPRLIGRYYPDTSVSDIRIAGKYAYCITNAGMFEIIDISTPSLPNLTGSFNIGLYNYCRLALSGNYVYVGTSDALYTIDVSKPALPVICHTIESIQQVQDMKINGSTLYVVGRDDDGYTDDLLIVDISSPQHPGQTGRLEMPGSTYGVDVSGTIACLSGDIAANSSSTAENRGIVLIDVSIPSAPVKVTQTATPGYAMGITIRGNYAYITDRTEGLTILNISDPSNPMLIDTDETFNEISGIVFDDAYGYVLNAEYKKDTFTIVDMSIPAAPEVLSVFEGRSDISADMAMKDQLIYISSGTLSGFEVIDVSHPETPLLVRSGGQTAFSAKCTALKGNYAFQGGSQWMGGGLRLWDITDPSGIQFSGDFSSPDTVLDIQIIGNTAYMAAGDQGLQIYNISDPETAEQTGVYNNPGIIDYASYVYVNGSYAYLADDRMMNIIDISNPAVPLFISAYDTGNSYAHFIVDDTYAYILGDGFQVVDISNPTSVVPAGSCKGLYGNGMTKSGEFVYLATDASLQILDVSTPGLPVVKGIYKTGGTPVDVIVEEGIIFLLLKQGGIRILEAK